MKLLSQNDLEHSPVVANNRMNRERNAVGVNSYERDIQLSPIEFLTHQAVKKKSVAWLDICCGQAKALIQTAQYLEDHFPNDNFSLTGIDWWVCMIRFLKNAVPFPCLQDLSLTSEQT